MTTARRVLNALLFICLTAVPLVAHGATTDFRVLFNDDNNVGTGCLVAGLEGVDQILITRVETTETTAKVTSTFRQLCQNGALTAPVALETQGWNAGYTHSSGELLVETRVPFSAFAAHGMHKMRIAIDARQGSLAHVALTSNPGNAPVFFPAPSIGRRRAVGSPGDERVITLDGVVAVDWKGIKPKFDNIGSEGAAGLRMLKLFGFADVDHDYLYFQYEANISTDAPFAKDDDYTRTVGQGLTVPGVQGDPTVLANDTDPNGLPLKATLVSQPPGGEVTLDQTGGFTYTPTNPASTAADTFEYMATNDQQNSNVAKVTISVDVPNVNEAPTFTSTATPSVLEGTTAVVTLAAADPESDPVTFSIVSGVDQARFTIFGGNQLRFIAAPDYEVPTSNGGGNTYIVVVTADDGQGNTTDQTITVTVTNLDEAPFFTSGSSFNVPENTTAVTTVAAQDPDGTPIAYSIGGGADAAQFAINSSTGVLSFISAPDFESPADTGANNGYTVFISATDGNGSVTMQTVTVTVTGVDEAPVFTSTATPSIPENTTAVLTVATADQEGQTITYSLTGGVDQAFFSINPGSGALAFLAAPNFEAPGDNGANNTYVVQVTATDGANPVQQLLTVTVTNVNEAPSFTSGTSASVPENTIAAATVTTTDPEGSAITYSLTGGADQARFTIGAASGLLSFIAAPNFEVPTDADTNNQYVVQVTATDGANPINQTLTITVTDVNEAPTFTSGATPSVVEGTTAVTTVTTTDQEGNTVTYSITGGVDQAFFSINTNSGALTFNSPRDFEAPADNGANNTYIVQVTATDGTNPVNQTLTVTVTDLNEAPVFTSGAAPSVPENTTAILTVTTTDPENNSITYSLTGGVDQAFFSITGGGVLTFLAPRNFEAPADSGANNTYVVQVTANDGTNVVNQTITVTVTDVNEAPVFTSGNAASVPENTTAVSTVTTTDQEGNTVTYTLTGGADVAKFAVGLNTGVLTFLAAPNYDIPGDANADNQYIVQVTANDGTNAVNQTITVTVTDVNEAPAFTSANSNSIPENTTSALTVTTFDPESASITYSITGGLDMGSFSIGSSSGLLTFNAAPNFEAPTDSNTDNQYVVQVTATDGVNPVNQTITITVTNVNESPSFTSGNTPSIPENGVTVTTVTTSDPEGQTVTYTVTGGNDAAKFAVDANTGVLTFLAAPDFETPTDSDTDNQYEVAVTATDGTNPIVQSLIVTVTDVNEAPSFTSGATPSIPENTTAVITVTTTDPENNTITYSVTGGADQALFTINTNSGALSFLAAPDFEAPADNGANNVYDVQVTATDGTNPVVQNLAVTVTNQNDPPAFTSGNTANVPENTTAVTTVTTTDPEAQTVTYTVTGGADAALFAVGLNSGVLTFLSAPNFELPGDVGGDNVYVVQVTANDGTNNVNQTITVTVTNVNEAPSFTSGNAFNVAENTTAITTVTTTDPEAQPVTYTLTGGVDQAFFSITTGGVLTFLTPRNFEAPADNGANNTYVVQVTATDGTNPVNQTITVTMTNVNEAPTYTSGNAFSVPENTTAVTTVTTNDEEAQAVTYTVTGGADSAKFAIGLNTGVLTFIAPPDFDIPGDANADNQYIVQITATDGTNPVNQTITVTVTNVNEAPSFTSGNAFNVAENTTAITTVTTSDPEAQAVTYTLTGGVDQAFFSITSGGVLTFLTPRNFEAPADSGANNTYVVQVTATDGTNPVNQTITVTITNVNEAPTYTSGNAFSVPENTTAVTTVTTIDEEAQAVTYTVTGGADSAKFALGLNSGVLTFIAPPDFDIPGDANADNQYIVQITATDGTNPVNQTITVTVTNVNEAPSYTSGNAFSVPENTTAITTVTTTDPEAQAVTYTLTGGVDQAFFSITSGGVLTFLTPRNFEAPADSGANNTYVVQVTATDGTNPVNQTITVTITNLDEAPAFTSSATQSVPENTTAITTVTSSDPEGAPVTYTLTGGVDQAFFSITSGGVLTFLAPRNFEAPADSGADNTYVVQVTATDGTNPVNQTITVTVTNVNEAPSFTSGNSFTQAENLLAVTTVTTTDPEAQTVTYTVTGGADQALFSIGLNDGMLTFIAPPNFEAPTDAGGDNIYNVQVTATDGTNPVNQAITITITNVNEGPQFTSSATPSVPENTTAAVTVIAPDPEGNAVTYTITGGADQLLFSVGPNSGALTFNAAPNFEAPADAGANNVYDVQVTATDGSIPTTQNIAVTVTNVNEAPAFTSSASPSVPENTTAVITTVAVDPDGTIPTYSITGGADALKFSITGAGVLTFVSAPNFEAPTDADTNNIYLVQVTATDGTNPVVQSLSVTVTDVNEAPIFATSNTQSIPENSTAVVTVSAPDPEGAAVTYSLTGGADQLKFSIVGATGVLAFQTAPNFEIPTDAGLNNVYDVQITATDGVNPAVLNMAVTVTNVNEAPVNVVPGGQTFNEDINRVFNAANSNVISISDVDAGTNPVLMTLVATNGTLSTNGVAGLTFTPPGAGNDGVDDATLTFTGTIANINTALNGLTYKPTANYYGAAQITITTDDQGNTGSGGAQSDSDPIALTISPVNDPPVATVKTHTTHSGLGLTINAATNTGELKEGATDVDDHDPFSELTVQIVGGSVTPAGSTITLIDASDGSFYYEPRGGVSGVGSGSFQFQVCDDGSVPLGLAPACSAATTVTFNITGPDLWFVDDSDAAGCGVNCNGSRTKPLVGLNTSNANFVGRGTGDKIFAFSGTYNHGHTFAATEQLIGQASSGAFDTVIGVSVPGNGTLDTRPSLSGAAVTLQNTVTAAPSILMRGVAIASAGNGFVGTGATSATVLESSVSAAGKAIDLTNSGASVSGITFTTTSSSAGTHGISLQNVTGVLAFGNGSLNGNTTAAFFLKDANNSTITYGGSMAPTGTGRAVLIGTTDGNAGTNASNGLEAGSTVTLSGNMTAGGVAVYESSGGTLNLSGTTQTFSTGATNAIEMIDNPGTTINFSSGNLAVTTVNGHGINATGGGTINITGNDNTVNTTGSGVAINWAMLTGVHSNGTLRFKTVNKSGSGAKGIVVDFHNGSFAVTGDDDNNGIPDSLTAGGTISGTSARGAEFIDVDGGVSLGGMTFNNAATTNGDTAVNCGSNQISLDPVNCNAPLHFSIVQNVTLQTMNINGSSQMGINGNSVTNLTMNNVEVQNAGDESGEHGVNIKNLLGTATVTNCNLHGNETDQMRIINTTGTLSNLSITASTLSTSAAPNGTNGALFGAYNSGTSMTVNVGDNTAGGLNTFQNNVATGVTGVAGTGTTSGATMNLNVRRNTFFNQGSGVVAQAAGSGTNTINYSIQNNSVSNSGASQTSAAIAVDGNATAIVSGDITGNTIGTSGVFKSGANCGSSCTGISVVNDGSHASSIVGNTIQRVDLTAIYVLARTNRNNITITGNLIREPDNTVTASGTSAAIYIQGGTSAASTQCVLATIGGSTTPGGYPDQGANAKNRIEGPWDPNGFTSEIFVQNKGGAGSSFRLPGGTAAISTNNDITDATGPDVTTVGTFVTSNTPCP